MKETEKEKKNIGKKTEYGKNGAKIKTKQKTKQKNDKEKTKGKTKQRK